MSVYSINKIFEDSAVNAALDRMYYFLEASEVPGINTVFALTGKAAVHLQDDTTGAVNSIVFITNSTALYEFVQTQLPGLLHNRGVLLFKERTIFYMPGYAVEIWFTVSELDIVVSKDVYVENKIKINPILL